MGNTQSQSIINLLTRNALFSAIILCGLILVFLSLYGLWSVQYLAFLDHPSHLFREKVMKDYDKKPYDFKLHFIRNLPLAPNLGSDLLVFLLGHIFPIQTSSKIFYSLYILLLPLSAWYLARIFSGQNLFFPLLTVALIFNHFVIMGNENFVSGIPVFLFFIGYWYKNRDNTSSSLKTICLLVLSLVLYYCHMIMFVCALMIVLLITLMERRDAKSWIRNTVVFLPTLLIFLCWIFYTRYLAQGDERDAAGIVGFASWGDKMLSIIAGASPGVIQNMDIPFKLLYYILLAAVMIVSALHVYKTANRNFLWAILLLILSAFLLPKWLVIFEPGQRIFLVALLLLAAFLPCDKKLQYAFCLLLLGVALPLRIREIQYLNQSSQTVSRIVEPWMKNLTAKERQNLVLPLTLHPFTRQPSFHKAYEYYFLMHGGMGPYHLISARHSVRYRNKPPAPEIYQPLRITKEVLSCYDTVLLIGRSGAQGEDLLAFLKLCEFEPVAENDVTVVLMKKGTY